MPRIVHFEVHASEPDRAVRFYRDTFGWTAQAWGAEGYWLLTTGPKGTPGINGGLMLRRGPPPKEGQPVNAFVCTVEVDDLDRTTTKAVANGAKVVVPKMPIPGVGWLTYVHDTEGNLLGITQPDPKAA